jgi:CDP-diacylglycerol---glycerol-3-phosphate 3-phosphatidyltransferase
MVLMKVQNINFEVVYVLVLFALAALVSLAYGVRLTLKGPAHFDRVEKQGGSALLNKGVMELGYWVFQPLARLLVFCHITPNQISWASLILGIFAGTCLAFGHFGSGAVLATFSAILDSLDGIVARLTSQSSDAGEVLDATVDRYVEFFFLGGLVIYYREIPALLVLSLLALVGAFMVSYSSAKAEALQMDPPKGNMRRPERAMVLTLGAALAPLTIPWLEVERDYPIAIAHPMVIALCLVAVLGNGSAIERLWHLAKMVRLKEKKMKEETAISFDSDPLKLEKREGLSRLR